MGFAFDWRALEEVVERAVRRARAEELKDVADAVKTLADYMKIGFEKVFQVLQEHSKRIDEHSKRIEELSKRIEEHSKILEEHSKRIEELSKRIEEHSKILEEHSKRIEELSKRVARLEVVVGSVTRRVGIDLEKTILSLYRDVLVWFGIEDVDKVEKFVYIDAEGRYMGKGDTLEIDIYIHNKEIFFIEVKSLVDVEDVMWFNHKCSIASRIIGKEPKRKIMVSIHSVKEALAQAKKYEIDIIYGELID
ncbi:MAG: DUF3782 domain-containing protein [Ignisphaera sp.]